MTPDRWEGIKGLFGEAMEMAAPERAAYLDRETAHDSELRREVEALLARHDTPGAFLDKQIPRLPVLESALSGQVFAVGQLVNGRFRIERFLGQGGMGEVYQVEDLQLKTRVALKTVRAEAVGDQNLRERFRREILLARQVTHANVCRIFDVGEHHEALFLTMELLVGETLAERLTRDGRFSPRDVLPLAKQMAAALDTAHAAGVIHRDFKAANVMLAGSEGEPERAVVTDFGLARGLAPGSAASATTQIGAAGTPAYMAPEQIEGKPAGPAADIYAFGVVLYEMVTGRRPYEDESPLALAAKKVSQAPPAPDSLTPGLDIRWQAVILRCLAIDPARRFASAGAAVAALDRPWTAAAHRLRQSRGWLAAAVLIAAISAGGLWIWKTRSPPALAGEPARWYIAGIEALHAGASWRASKLLERVTASAPAYPLAHARLAEAYADLDMGDRAKDELIKTSDAAPDLSRLPAAESLQIEAARSTVLREFDKAAKRYGQVVSAETGDRKTGALLDLGRSLERDHIDKATDAYQRALAADSQNAAAHLRLAILAGRKGDLGAAARLFAAAEADYRLIGDFEGVAEMLLQKSRAFRNARKLQDARDGAQQALTLAAASGNVSQQIRARLELDKTALLEGKLALAADESAAVAEAARKAGLDSFAVQGLIDLANANLAQYKLVDAETIYGQAIELARRTRTAGGEAQASLNLAGLRMRRGEDSGVLTLIDGALRFYRQGGYREQSMGGLGLLTDERVNEGHYADAIESAHELLAMAESGGDRFQAAQAREREAYALNWQGNFPAVVSIYAATEAVFQSLGRRLEASYAQANRADMLWRLGRDAQAATSLTDAESGAAALGASGHSIAVRIGSIRADQALARGDFAAAQRFAAAVLKEPSGGSPYREIAAELTLGVARAHAGAAAEGRKICDDASRKADGLSMVGIRLSAKIAAAEARIASRDRAGAAALAKNALAECEKFGMEEMAYRAATIAADQAGISLHASALQKLWGTDAFDNYRRRPDLLWLRRTK